MSCTQLFLCCQDYLDICRCSHSKPSSSANNLSDSCTSLLFFNRDFFCKMMDSKILQHSSIFYKLEKSFNQNFKTLTVSCMNKPVETLIDKQVIVIVDKALSSDSQFQFLFLCM